MPPLYVNVTTSTGNEYVSSVAWTSAGTVRVVYARPASTAPGDTDTSLDSRAFTFVRTSTGDGADDVIDWSASGMRNIIDGGGGNDTLYGGADIDQLIGGAGTNLLNGFGGDDTITVSGVGDSVYGGSGTTS